jgi:hypothetical protein
VSKMTKSEQPESPKAAPQVRVRLEYSLEISELLDSMTALGE